MPRQQNPAVARRLLAARLRAARSEAHLKQREVADALGWSTSKILRIENAQSPISKSDLLALMTRYPALAEGATKELVQLGEIARASRQDIDEKMLTPEYRLWLQYEAYADVIRQYETKLIPGQLQIESYSTALVRGLYAKDTPPGKIQATLDARKRRAADVTGPEGPTATFIIDEGALRRGVGNESGERGYAVMIEQLRHIKRMNTRGRKARGEIIEADLNPDIGIHIVPFEMGAYEALVGPFALLEFENGQDPNMIYFENPYQDIVIREMSDETACFIDMFVEMEKFAPPIEETGNLIDGIIRLMEQGRNGVPAARKVG